MLCNSIGIRDNFIMMGKLCIEDNMCIQTLRAKEIRASYPDKNDA